MIRLINELKKAVRLMVGKCIIEAASKASDGVNADIMLLGNERHYGLRLMQHYGFASVPNADSEGVALFVGGARDNGVVIASQCDASKIPALEKGEVALFSEFGQSVILKKDGSVSVTPASGKDIVFNGRVISTADIVAEGGLKSVGEVAANVQKTGNNYVDVPAVTVHLSQHKHNITSPGSPSGPPVG